MKKEEKAFEDLFYRNCFIYLTSKTNYSFYYIYSFTTPEIIYKYIYISYR